uniref:Uncharacterized protein n=1 Tax=Prolemur simus TaxID=1328070 RepID=A0A8C9DR68_PROSS
VAAGLREPSATPCSSTSSCDTDDEGVRGTCKDASLRDRLVPDSALFLTLPTVCPQSFYLGHSDRPDSEILSPWGHGNLCCSLLNCLLFHPLQVCSKHWLLA